MSKIDQLFNYCRALRALSNVPGFSQSNELKDMSFKITGMMVDEADKLNLKEVEVWRWFDKDNFDPMTKRRVDGVTIHRSADGQTLDVLAPHRFDKHDVMGVATPEDARMIAGALGCDIVYRDPDWKGGEPQVFDYSAIDLSSLVIGSQATSTYQPPRPSSDYATANDYEG